MQLAYVIQVVMQHACTMNGTPGKKWNLGSGRRGKGTHAICMLIILPGARVENTKGAILAPTCTKN